MSELFEQLESNRREVVEATKQKILEQFGTVRDSWLLNGLYEYYLCTNSTNTIAILVNIREPHNNYLFERLSDSISKNSKIDVKVQALTLLGHIVKNQPTWVYKLPEHQLLKDVLKLLKGEVEILPLISALLVLIALIPMAPYSMGDLLNDIFEIFSRLASWNCNPGRPVEEQIIHMQVAVYALFLRLYGMFPCNFLAYLRTQYKDKNKPVFFHTIKPMLESVKMNPSLVTTAKDNETASERWKKKAVHDIIVECERFSLDVSDTCCAHDSCQLASGFRSRSGTSNSGLEASYFRSFKSYAASITGNERGEYFTPSVGFNPHTPPVGGVTIPTITPQPEFTHDENVVPQAGSSPPEAAIEATPETTPVLQEELKTTPSKGQAKSLTSIKSPTQPQSPSHKDKSPFKFPAEAKSPLSLDSPPQQRWVYSTPTPEKTPLTSPFKVKTKTGMDVLLKKSPTKSSGSSVGADEELMFIEERCELTSQPTLKQADSVLHESEDSASDHMDDDRRSPCTSGGIHMPNSKSMKDFAQHICRLRHHSQCNPEPEHPETSSGGSSETGESAKVRRANSCPEMKKSPVSSLKDYISRTLDETDEENDERAESAMSNGIDKAVSVDTQTDNFWPMPYEHLFLEIFPTLGTTDLKSGSFANVSQEKQPSIYEILDRFIEKAVQGNERDAVKNLKNQLQLVHQQLLFERHRREIHAFKNRRFLADAKSTQVLEEHNSALRDQVQLQETDIINLKQQLGNFQRDKEIEIHRLSIKISQLEDKCKSLEYKNKTMKDLETEMSKEVESLKSKCSSLNLEKQKTESQLLDALVEAKLAKEKANESEKLRAQLGFVNKQMLLMGELQLKYKERLDDVSSLRRYDEELIRLKESYTCETKAITQRLKDKKVKLDAYAARVSELEQIVAQNEETISKQKRTLNGINEENEEKMKALENKYQTQLGICRSLETKILELLHLCEMSTTKKNIHSPDTSSCQEVHVPSDKASGGAAGVSERSSPLSCSLASSDGSSAVAQSDIRELRGLQALMGEGSPSSDVKPDIPKDLDSQQTTSSTKHD